MTDENLVESLNQDTVRQAWREVCSWVETRPERAQRRFFEAQPNLAAYVLAMLEDEPEVVADLGLRLAMTLDRAYELALGAPTTRLDEDVVMAAAEASEQRFLTGARTQPEIFMRSLLYSREFAAPQLPIELIGILFDTVDTTPELEAEESAPLLFLIYSLARIFENGQGLANGAELHSLGTEIEQRTGHPLPKVGRNAPCPCGSGKKFKQCCLSAFSEPPDEQPAAEQLRFAEYFALVEAVMDFAQADRSPDGIWHAKYLREFEEKFEVGEDGAVPDSVQINYALFDLRLPRANATMGEIYGRKRGRQLDARARRQLRELCQSYLAFYELVGSDDTRQTFREIATDAVWSGCDVDAPSEFDFEVGEIWLCRFVGPRDDAIAFGQPLVYPPEALDEIEQAVAAILEEVRAQRPDDAEAPFATLMKRAGELFASYITLTSPEDGDDDAAAGDEDESDLDIFDDEEALLEEEDDPEPGDLAGAAGEDEDETSDGEDDEK